MSTLRRYRSTLNRWGITENPFRSTPPDDPSELARVFYGRGQELEIAIPTLYEGRNVLVRGAWGIGKTALILTLLDRLQTEVAELDEQMLVLYLDRVVADSPNDFYRLLLLAVSDRLATSHDDEEAQAIANNLKGFASLQSKTTTEGKVTLGIVSFGAKQESPAGSAIANPYPLLISMLDKAQNYYTRLVLAVDDLDKQDSAIIQTILEESLALFRQGKKRAFLMTGRGFTSREEANLKALGIFSEDLTLQAMSQEDLYRIAVNYLNLVRKTPTDDPYPFTEEVLKRIAEYALGIPRQLQVICEKVLRQAAMEGCDRIDETAFASVWDTIRQEVTYSLDPHLLRLIYIAYEAGGISEDIDDSYLEQLGVLTFVQLLPMLKTLEGGDALVRQEDESGFRYVPSKLFLPPSKPDEQ